MGPRRLFHPDMLIYLNVGFDTCTKKVHINLARETHLANRCHSKVLFVNGKNNIIQFKGGLNIKMSHQDSDPHVKDTTV